MRRPSNLPLPPSLLRSLLFSLILALGVQATAADRPNVLFISIDDLNDWVSVFGGHPKSQTPHIDRFASEGAMVFKNAHGAGSICGPSRSAMLSGFMPSRTGAYGNSNNMLESPLVQANATLPEYFSKHGYHALSRGKIYHKHDAANGIDAGQWAFDQYERTQGGSAPDKTKLTSRIQNLINGKPGPDSQYTGASGSEFAWSPTQDGKEDTKDYKTALWAADRLQEHYEKPFFMAIGISRPHLPFYAPQEFFDLYDPDDEYAPPIRENDLDDILTPNGKPKFKPTSDYLWLKENDLFDEVARGYLAASSYADACLGVIFDALKRSPHYKNTIVVVWGDHGWHLGEKLRYRKGSGWSESTRIPLLVRLPGMNQRSDSDRLVSMIDFYPTLIDLCNLPAKPILDGRSFAPLLANPTASWDYPVVTIHGFGNASIRDDRWRYIRYSDGTEELYDLQSDPHEWSNLISRMTETTAAAKRRLSQQIPSEFAPSLSNSKGRHKRTNQLDTTIKPTRILTQLN